mgnify:FL=1|jgi:ATP synthase protein I
MDDFAAHLQKTQRITFFFLSFCFFAWALFPPYRAYIAGLILGTAVSLINSLYLAWKIRQLTNAVLERSKRKINLGFVTRAAMALLAALLAWKSEHVALSTTMAGLLFVPLATFLLAVAGNRRAGK